MLPNLVWNVYVSPDMTDLMHLGPFPYPTTSHCLQSFRDSIEMKNVCKIYLVLGIERVASHWHLTMKTRVKTMKTQRLLGPCLKTIK